MPDAFVLDLDGPLLETRQRQHACYAEFLASVGVEPLPLDLFWEAKRSGASTRQVLERQGAGTHAKAFAAHWNANIEREDLLHLDTVQPGALDALDRLGRGARRILCTLRQDAAACRRQLERTGLAGRLDAIHVVPHARGAQGKADAAAGDLAGATRRIWVGDTEVDADAARATGCELWLVECGIRSRALLEPLRPARLAPDLAALVG